MDYQTPADERLPATHAGQRQRSPACRRAGLWRQALRGHRPRSNDVQLRTSHELWHKENILNVTVQRFPAGWQYGAIIDGDFHMTRRDWALEAVHQLQHYDFVQLFSSYSDLSSTHRPFRVMASFA